MSSRPVESAASVALSVKKQVLFISIILTGILLLGEVGIRTWAYYFRTSYERYNWQTGRLELVPNLHYRNKDGHEFRINSRGFVGPEFAETPPPGTTRIIAVGDSCTFTLGLWEIAYPAVAERLLISRTTQRRFEYINAGIEGYNSSFALGRIRDELLRYQPKVVTIYIGWNDLMKQNPESRVEAGDPSLIARLMDESYLVKAYRKLIFVVLRPMLFRPKVDPDVSDRHAYDRYVPRQFESNLRAMISVLKQRGVHAILFTLPTVLKPGMTAEDLRKHGVFFPYYAGSYSVERLLSLHAAYNRTIRNVGMDEQVPVVDLDAEFRNLERGPLFWDTMHPSQKGNAFIARTVVSQIAPLLDN